MKKISLCIKNTNDQTLILVIQYYLNSNKKYTPLVRGFIGMNSASDLKLPGFPASILLRSTPLFQR